MSFKRFFPLIARLFAIAFIFSVVNGCDTFYWDSKNKSELVGNKQELRVAILQGPLTFVKPTGSGQAAATWGLEHDLMSSLADEFGLHLTFVVVSSVKEMEQKLADYQVDLGAGRMTAPTRTNLMVGPSYQDTRLVLVCPKTQAQHAELAVEQIGVLANNDSLALRHDLAAQYPKAKILTAQNSRLTLNQVNEASNTCLVLEKLEADFHLRSYPNLSIQRTVATNTPVHFVTQKSALKIQKMLYLWNQKISQNGELARILARYSLPLNAVSTSDVSHLKESLQTDMQQYENFFREAGQEHQVPWQVLAAVSFQESHWQDSAVSPTGVRGLMMITEETADHIGIADRTDPEQSIWGGAKYLRKLFRMQPEALALRDRWALTFAAYNVGYGHLKDAQTLALQKGKNPYSWKDLREVLPLLSNPKYLSQLEFGPARGKEPVDFTERVLGFLDLMLTLDKAAVSLR